MLKRKNKDKIEREMWILHLPKKQRHEQSSNPACFQRCMYYRLIIYKARLGRLTVAGLFQAFNLYHADFWVIGPATAGHGRGGCSYVELVATKAPMQRPLWRLGSRKTYEQLMKDL